MVILTLFTSLMIAGVAAWYSIVGLTAIFAGAVIPIIIMGVVLEIGKLVTAAWLHQNWENAVWWMKGYLTSAVFLLMIITSLGIFGFLSKAHLENSISTGGTNELQIENLERQIKVQKRSITDSETVLSQLDGIVQTLLEYDRVRGKDGAVAMRESQLGERDAQNDIIDNAYNSIETLQLELAPLEKDKLAIEVEVGPLRYIAELIYGDEASSHFDEAVRWVIILLIITFDPLAIVLLLAASQGFRDKKKKKMYYDDGNLRVDPENVVSGHDVARGWDVVSERYEDVASDIPSDEDISDYDYIEEPQTGVGPPNK